MRLPLTFIPLLLVVVCSCDLLRTPLYATESAESAKPEAAVEPEPETLTTEVAPNKVVGQPTPESIAKFKEQATEAEQLTEEIRTEIHELCDKAANKLAEAKKFVAATALLQQELDNGATDMAALQKPPAEPPLPIEANADATVEEMRSRLSAADQQVSTAREQAQQIASEIERRTARRQALPELLTKCREQLATAEAALKQPIESDVTLLVEAKRQYRTLRHDCLVKEQQWLEQENRTYEANSRLWLARRDAAEKKLQATTDALKRMQELAAEAQRLEAERQAQAARLAAANAHPAVKAAAAINAELAEENQRMVTRMQQVREHLTEARDLGLTMKNRLDGVTKRAEAAQNSPAMGAMLRTQQDQLPSLKGFRERLQARPVEIAQLSLDVYEWDVLKRESLYIDKVVAQAEKATGADSLTPAAAAELRRVLEARADILTELISNASDFQSRMDELDTAEKQVVATTEQLAAFVAEQVLWVRSAPTLTLQDFTRIQSLGSNLRALVDRWNILAETLSRDARQRPQWWILGSLAVLVLLFGRRKARTELTQWGEAASKPTATLFRPTVEASFSTIFLAAPIPVICGFLGWRLGRSGDALAFAAGWALMLFAAAFAMLNLVHHASRNGGLGTHHFGWDPKGLAAIYRATRSLKLVALPLLAIAVGVEIAHDETSINSLGRLSLIGALLMIGIISFRLFRPNSALGASLAASAKGSWFARIVRVLAPLATLAVLGLIAASVAGYHYTAMQLTRRVCVSCLFVFACFALRSLLMRWLLVSYRRVAMQRAREKRKALLEAQEKENATGDTPIVEVEPQVKLSDINQQARKLVGVGAGCAFVLSMWFVWGDVLPALGILGNVDLWVSSLVPIDPDAGMVWVTLADVLLAIGILVFTWFAGHNLPGLLEIAVLQKLPLDAGARYAASSITRYMIMVIGIALGMRQLGIGWQSVQWLVAAMTVGLGFGLQEIFANFVSGIILLFERPARVGDTVTVGTITGTVTKIRIRATTILDWDNKELIVPNKDFVTGNLVNWTLSNPNLRLIIRVGIAYGSDTRLATKLLYQVAEENSSVLESPEPIVVFSEFGDSSLNFELRLFVDDLGTYRRLKHELHLAIDDVFKQHHIEIAFPQCDMHIRTMPAELAHPAKRQTAAALDPGKAAA